jgi:hypothetical protein
MPADFQTTFLPSRNGWRFPNSFTRFGVCGGMCFSALDQFHAGAPIPDDDDRGPGRMTPLFRTLTLRQWQSVLTPRTLWKIARWQLSADEDGEDGKPGVGAWTEDEWAKARRELDAGRPAVLCLIRTRGVRNPTVNHQVVAIGYEHDPTSGRLVIHVYDPNWPRNDRVTLTLHLGRPRHRLDASQSTGERLRGFFVIPYDRPVPPR